MLVLVVLGLLVGAVTNEVFAQKGNSNANEQDELRENQRVAKAERALKDARESLSALQKELKAEAAVVKKEEGTLIQIKKRIRQVRETVEDKLGASVGIPAAFKNAKAANEALEATATRIKTQLASDTAWKQAQQAAEAAKKTKQQLNEGDDDLDLDEADLKRKLRDLSQIIAKPSEIERQAIELDPEGAKVLETANKAQKELQECRNKLPKDKIDSDPSLAKLVSEETKQEKEVAKTEANLTKIRAETAKAQKKLMQVTIELRNAKAADAADSNRNNQGKPKKK